MKFEKDSALILVDCQNDFSWNGKLNSFKNINQNDDFFKKVNNIVNEAKRSNLLIIATLDWHPKNHISFLSSHKNIDLNDDTEDLWPEHAVQNTKGAKIVNLIEKNKINFFIYKGQYINVDSYSAFFDNDHKHKTELNEILKQYNIKELYVLGLILDYCVKYTIMDGLALGYKINLLSEYTIASKESKFEPTVDILIKNGCKIIR